MISREQALEIAKHSAAVPATDVSDQAPAGCRVYAMPANCWYILFRHGVPGLLGSSRLVCVSKDDGRILYDGSANEEG